MIKDRRFKLTQEQINYIGRYPYSPRSGYVLARKFGVALSTITRYRGEKERLLRSRRYVLDSYYKHQKIRNKYNMAYYYRNRDNISVRRHESSIA